MKTCPPSYQQHQIAIFFSLLITFLITPTGFLVHSWAIRATWEVSNRAVLSVASYQCSGATSARKMSLLISPHGVCQCGESNPANEVKREKLWEEKNGLRSKCAYSTTPRHAAHFLFFSVLNMISLHLFLCAAIYCATVSEFIHQVSLFCCQDPHQLCILFLRDIKNAQARLFVKTADCITMTP